VIGKDEEWDRILNDDDGQKRMDHLPSYAYRQSENLDGSPTGSPPRSSSISSSNSIRSFSSECGLLPSSLDIHFETIRDGPKPSPKPVEVPKTEPVGKAKNFSFPKNPVHDPNVAGDLYPKKAIEPRAEEVGLVSSLAKLMSAAKNMPANPFFEYVQFDGASNPGSPVKTINVYLVMSQGEERWTPTPVVVLMTAKVSDLIGLICHLYVQSGRQPTLKNSTPDGYTLFMADDDGLVEEDFPPLDPREPISKYDLPLALVEMDLPPEEEAPPIIITVYIPQKGWAKIQVDDEALLMKEILQIILAKRRITERRGISYILEKQSERGKPIDLDLPLKEVGTLEFCLIRLNSGGRDDQENESQNDLAPLPFMMPPMPEDRRYKVNIVKKIRNAEVHLDINAERIEITPLVPGSVKSLVLEMECLLDAHIIAEKAKGTATFRIRYDASGGGDMKQVDFKCVTMVAKEIVEQISELLRLYNQNFIYKRGEKKKASQ